MPTYQVKDWIRGYVVQPEDLEDLEARIAAFAATCTTEVHNVATEAEMLAASANQGDLATRGGDTFILTQEPASVLGNWKKISGGMSFDQVQAILVDAQAQASVVVDNHRQATTGVHGIADAAQLATHSDVAQSASAVKTEVQSETQAVIDTAVDGLMQTIENEVQTEASARIAADQMLRGDIQVRALGIDEDGVPIVQVFSYYGIDSNGTAYYDPEGAAPGEEAILGIGPDGVFTLTSILQGP